MENLPAPGMGMQHPLSPHACQYRRDHALDPPKMKGSGLERSLTNS